ncbi:MAG: geranylgeranylglycerol-phosphate geranylgeranyltransferase [Bacteroidia bacterium]|nr:geranylgeranylglycerol-phosphate geranylgeranyltransferase [Bacteroidia bacterium]
MSLKGAFRIFRLPNLLMVGATMYLIRWSIIKPLLGVYGIDLQISELAFLGLVLSTVLITGAGYVINDYHDVRADQINKPKKVVVDRHVSRRSALFLHWLLNFIGVSAGIIFSIIYHVPWMILIFTGAPLLLWYYSVRLKHLFLIGNLAVSLLTATVPMLVILFEYPLLARNYRVDTMFFPHGLFAILIWVGAFAFFAFMTNLIREIIKDAQDIKGDMELNSRTLPISCGLKKTKGVIIGLTVFTVMVLGFFFLTYLKDWISLGYYLFALFLPFAFLAIKTLKSAEARDFDFLSQWVKLIMLLGLLYAPVVHWLIRNLLNR